MELENRVSITAHCFWVTCPNTLRPDSFGGPLKIVSNGYREYLPRGKSGRSMKLTTLPPLSICVHGIILKHRDKLYFSLPEVYLQTKHSVFCPRYEEQAIYTAH